MSLRIGKAFVRTLRSSEPLMRLLGAKEDSESRLVGARLFAVARPTQDEAEDRIPYVIMMPDGITTQGSKDGYENADTATVRILCVADTYEALIDLASLVRSTLADGLCYHDDAFYETDDFVIDDYTFSASAVSYDADKPCYFQTLTYQCFTSNNE